MKPFLISFVLSCSVGAAQRPDLTGKVTGLEGAPIQNAMVFIYTAGPKVGASSFCPSCYADCRKKALTDAKGEFLIESLDPALLFRLLVVAKGHLPEFAPGIDPARGPKAIVLKPIDPATLRSETRMAGVIIDQEGHPVRGAVLEVHGISKTDGGGQWGGTDKFTDPLAVSDDAGRFLLNCKTGLARVHVVVSAESQAKRWFSLTPGRDHLVRMDRGATVTGRILRNGRPVPGAAVAMVTVERQSGVGLSGFETITESEGKFTLLNVPSGHMYNLFTKMDAVPGGGLVPLKKVQVGEPETAQDVGSLALAPGFRIHGQVRLTDGASIPDKTRLILGRDEAWDSSEAVLAENGSFTFENVPAETVGLSIRIKGYKMAKQNPSLDWLNARLIGRVEADIDDLNILLEPGEWRFDREQLGKPAGQESYPALLPLRGAKLAEKRSL